MKTVIKSPNGGAVSSAAAPVELSVPAALMLHMRRVALSSSGSLMFAQNTSLLLDSSTLLTSALDVEAPSSAAAMAPKLDKEEMLYIGKSSSKALCVDVSSSSGSNGIEMKSASMSRLETINVWKRRHPC